MLRYKNNNKERKRGESRSVQSQIYGREQGKENLRGFDAKYELKIYALDVVLVYLQTNQKGFCQVQEVLDSLFAFISQN